ncbi:MAG: metal-sensitive transcriptional regulator [Verrucomicrobia bacterium]|nr:metal-sensitive transcriptional regulator [Verrucomicrobiota bacterium]
MAPSVLPSLRVRWPERPGSLLPRLALPRDGSQPRLRRIKGQIEAIERMIDADADTPDARMLVVSARQALKSFGDEVIEAHLHECIEGAAAQPAGRRESAPCWRC